MVWRKRLLETNDILLKNSVEDLEEISGDYLSAIGKFFEKKNHIRFGWMDAWNLYLNR